jgi:hypothetical protein
MTGDGRKPAPFPGLIEFLTNLVNLAEDSDDFKRRALDRLLKNIFDLAPMDGRRFIEVVCESCAQANKVSQDLVELPRPMTREVSADELREQKRQIRFALIQERERRNIRDQIEMYRMYAAMDPAGWPLHRVGKRDPKY